MPTLAEINDTKRQTVKLVTRVTPALKRAIDSKSTATGMPLAEFLRRAAVLWVRGDIDDMLPGAAEYTPIEH